MYRYLIILSFFSPFICAAYSSPGNVIDCAPNISSSNGTELTCSFSSLTLTATIICDPASKLDSFKWFLGTIDLKLDNSMTITISDSGEYYLVAYFDSLDEKSDTIIITQDTLAPTITITASSTNICDNGGTVLLTAISAPGVTFQWNGGPAMSTYSVTKAGTYTVTGTAPNGCTATQNITIGALANPVASITIPTPVPCAGESMDICGSGSGGVEPYTYLWKWGALTSTAKCPTITTLFGNYTFNLTITDSNGCISVDSKMFKPGEVPMFAAKVASPASSSGWFCEGVDFTILADTGANPNYSYFWQGPSGFTSTTNSNKIMGAGVAQSGSYMITVTHKGSGCSSSQMVDVSIQEDPKVSIIAPSICVGDDITLSANISSPAPNSIIPVNFLWSSPTFPGLPGLKSISVGPINAATTFGVEVSFPPGLGCDNAMADTIINPNLISEYNIIGDTIICANQWVIYSTDLDSLLARLGTINWSILPNSNFDSIHLTSNGSVIAIRFNAGTSHILGSTHSFGSCKEDAEDITISHSMSGTTTGSVDIYYYKLNNIHIVKDSTADCYQWGYYDPDHNSLVDIPGANYQAYAPGADFGEKRTYWVKTWNGPCDTPVCPNLSFMIREAEGTGFYPEPLYTVFPNPTNGAFTISAEGIPNGMYMLRIVDMLGRLVEMQEIDASPGFFQVQVHMQESAAGVYKILLSDPYGINSVFSLVKF